MSVELTERQTAEQADELSDELAVKRSLLPLGSVVVLQGSVKKLFIVARGSLVEGQYFEYGAFLYPEGMIDTNIAYFNGDDIMKVVFEGYRDDDDALVLEMLNESYVRVQAGEDAAAATVQVGSVALADPVTVPASIGAPEVEAAGGVPVDVDDPFASVRDLEDDDE